MVNPVLGASAALNKRFSKFTCDNWFQSQVLTSFIFEKNLSAHAVLRGKNNNTSLKHLDITCVHQKGFLKHEVSLSRSCNSLVSFETFLPQFYIFKHILTKRRPLFSCSYIINITNLVHSNIFICACFFFTVVLINTVISRFP